jgi:hypothetical protein
VVAAERARVYQRFGSERTKPSVTCGLDLEIWRRTSSNLHSSRAQKGDWSHISNFGLIVQFGSCVRFSEP